MNEKGEKDSLPLQVDPKCIQDALRAFLPPIKNDDARLDFYTMYKREATEYDMDYIKKYDEDLNITLIFAGLFSAVSSAFVIDVHSGLQPDPNEQSAALLRAILLTLNQSAIPNETPTIPPTQEDPASEIVTVTGLMYASLLISLLAAFTAMLGKQWLNRYLRNAGGSMIERCGDRQRKCDGLKKWPFHLFIESLPLMLQIALLLLACGLCKHMAFINTAVADVLITFTILGALFYLGIVIVGTSSYECPFQTPVSFALRTTWKTAKPHMITTLQPVVDIATSLLWLPVLTTLCHWWETIQYQILHVALWFPSITQLHQSHSPSLPITQPTPQHPRFWLASLHSLWEDIQCRILRAALHLPQIQPLSTLTTSSTSTWLIPTALAALHNTNANDVRCTSWILWNITDPEALDAAIRLAATIQWFVDGLNVEPPYDQIISILKGCFDSNGKIYPGSRDRAYHSGRAVLWIHICAMCLSRDFAERFPLPTIAYNTGSTSLDHDLGNLLYCCSDTNTLTTIDRMYFLSKRNTPAHSQWFSNALLHLSWAQQSIQGIFDKVPLYYYPEKDMKDIPLNTVLDHLLVLCIFFGWPVEEEVLKIQNKSDYFNQILSQFSQAMISAIDTSHPQCKLLRYALTALCDSENQTAELTRLAYKWCSVVCKNYSNLTDGKNLLLLSLKIGFRHLNHRRTWIDTEIIHTEYHQGMASIVFDSGDQEAIADLLYSWTLSGHSQEQFTLLNTCVEHLMGIQQQPLSPRLEHSIINAINLIGYQPFEVAEVGGFIKLLKNLQVHVKEMAHLYQWSILLLDFIQSSEGIQHLPHLYWGSLLQGATFWSEALTFKPYNPQTIISLEMAKEWQKLECWLGVIWMVWPPEGGKTIEEDLKHAMLLLSHQQPSAIQKLEGWVEKWNEVWSQKNIPKSFQKICRQVNLEVTQQTVLSHFGLTPSDEEKIQSTHSQLPALPLSFGNDTF